MDRIKEGRGPADGGAAGRRGDAGTRYLRALCLWLLATAFLYLCSAAVLALFGAEGVWLSALPTALLSELILLAFHLIGRARKNRTR